MDELAGRGRGASVDSIFGTASFFAHLLRLKIMPARAKVVKYEGDGDPDAPLADGQVALMFKETYRMVKTEDARLKTKPAGGKVVKYEGDSDPDAPRADGQVGEQRPVTAIEAAVRIACRYEA